MILAISAVVAIVFLASSATLPCKVIRETHFHIQLVQVQVLVLELEQPQPRVRACRPHMIRRTRSRLVLEMAKTRMTRQGNFDNGRKHRILTMFVNMLDMIKLEITCLHNCHSQLVQGLVRPQLPAHACRHRKSRKSHIQLE